MATECLLFLEDDPNFAPTLIDILYENIDDVSVAHARTLEDALAIINTSPVDIAIIDIGIPGAHELSAVHRIRQAAPLVPILILTASQDPTLEHRARQMVAVEWLHKGGSLRADDVLARLRLLDYCRRLLIAAKDPDTVSCVHRDGDHAPLKPFWRDPVVWALGVLMTLLIGSLSFWLKEQHALVKDMEKDMKALQRDITAMIVKVEREMHTNKTNIDVNYGKVQTLERYLQQVDSNTKEIRIDLQNLIWSRHNPRIPPTPAPDY